MSQRIDVIMPAYNRARYVKSAIASVLAEPGVSVRLIVVDDGSTDGSSELLEKLAAEDGRILVLRGESRGVSAARNRALSAVRAPFVSFLDSDDLFAPGKLVRQVRKLAADTALAAVVGHRLIFNGETNEPWDGARDIERKLDICLASGTFRRNVFAKLGKFDEELTFGEDLDLYLKLIEADWPVLIEPDAAVYHRRHGDNMTNDTAGLQRALVRAHHKSMKRRRLSPGDKIHLFFYQHYDTDTVVGRLGRRMPAASANDAFIGDAGNA